MEEEEKEKKAVAVSSVVKYPFSFEAMTQTLLHAAVSYNY